MMKNMKVGFMKFIDLPGMNLYPKRLSQIPVYSAYDPSVKLLEHNLGYIEPDCFIRGGTEIQKETGFEWLPFHKYIQKILF